MRKALRMMKKLRMLMKTMKNGEQAFFALLLPLMMPHYLKPEWRLEGAAGGEGGLKDAPGPCFGLPRPQDCYHCLYLCQKMVDSLMGWLELLSNSPVS